MNTAEIRAREQAATPGPWKFKETADYSEIYDNHSWGKALSPLAMAGSNLDDAAFIAASRALVPQLCDALEAAEKRAERAKRERDGAIADMGAMALAMRESEELQEGCCFACICDAQNLPDNCISPYGECPGYETTDCFKWRGERSVRDE